MKDKVTPELKNAFKNIIYKTKENGREYGFYICIGKDDKLFPSKIEYEGTMWGIQANIYSDTCPGKIQGSSHIHPHKPVLEFLFNRKFSNEDITQKLKETKERFNKLGISIQSPSHRDVLSSFIHKCQKLTEGTVCTGSDLETDKVECWTPKKSSVNFMTCTFAKIDNAFSKSAGDNPKKWISHLYDKEVIQL